MSEHSGRYRQSNSRGGRGRGGRGYGGAGRGGGGHNKKSNNLKLQKLFQVNGSGQGYAAFSVMKEALIFKLQSKYGEKIAEISPGMLRFITGNDVSPRSEVDRFSTIYGDTIVILDFYQSQELLEWMTFGQSEEVDRVRVTIHSLPGSHLVWLGWSIIMLGSIFSLSSDSIGQKKLEK